MKKVLSTNFKNFLKRNSTKKIQTKFENRAVTSSGKSFHFEFRKKAESKFVKIVSTIYACVDVKHMVFGSHGCCCEQQKSFFLPELTEFFRNKTLNTSCLLPRIDSLKNRPFFLKRISSREKKPESKTIHQSAPQIHCAVILQDFHFLPSFLFPFKICLFSNKLKKN